MSKKQNAEEDYITTPISVLSYITALERQLEEAREAYEFNLDLLSEKERQLKEARKAE